MKKNNVMSFEFLQKYIKESDDKLSGIMIHITNRCNLACKHCYNNSGIDTVEEDEMDYADWLNFVKTVLENGIKCLEISGGEPLLEMKLLKDIIHLVSEYRDVRLQINTNGILLTDDFLSYLSSIKNEKILQLSIDGHNSEIVGELRYSKEIFHHIITAIEMIKKYKNIKLILVHTINEKNKNYINEFLKWIGNLEPDIVVVGFLLPIGRGENKDSDCFMSLEERVNLYKKLVKLKRKIDYNFDFKVASPGGVFDLINYYRDEELWMVVDSDGDARYSCRMPYILGNIKRDSFEDLYGKLKDNVKKEKFLKNMVKDIELYTEFGYQEKISFEC